MLDELHGQGIFLPDRLSALAERMPSVIDVHFGQTGAFLLFGCLDHMKLVLVSGRVKEV